MKKVVCLCLLAISVTNANAQIKGMLKRGAVRAADRGIDKAIDEGYHKISESSTRSDNTSKTSVGKIVFSGSIDNLKKDAEIESGFAESFTVGAPIYFRAYYSSPLTTAVRKFQSNGSKSTTTEHARFKVKFIVDNEEQYVALMKQDAMDAEQKEEWVTFKGALQPQSTGSYLMQDVYQGFLAEFGARLANGNHRVTMQLIPYTDYPTAKEGSVIASGSFTLVGKEVVHVVEKQSKTPPVSKQPTSFDPKEAFLNVSYKLDGRKMTVLVDENNTPKPVFMEITSSTFTSDEYKIFALDGKKLIATYTVGRDVNKITMTINADKNKKQEFDLTTYLDRCSSSLEKDAVKRKNPVYWLYKNGYAK